MKAYNYGEYVYFNNSIDAPEEHHDRLILNQKPKLYITSLSKLMANSFTSLLKSFVDEIQKNESIPISKLEISYQKSSNGKKKTNTWNQCILQEKMINIF